eukprot:1144857-Pelagomonas_calceolata.AAC.3
MEGSAAKCRQWRPLGQCRHRGHLCRTEDVLMGHGAAEWAGPGRQAHMCALCKLEVVQALLLESHKHTRIWCRTCVSCRVKQMRGTQAHWPGSMQLQESWTCFTTWW